MRAFTVGLLLATLSVAAGACNGSSAPTAIVCQGVPGSCECALQDPTSSPQPTCNDQSPPDTVCCADPAWPNSGNCTCVTSSVFCGLEAGYVSSDDGGAGEDACVCSTAPENGMLGATCYPGATTTPGDALGICCMFAADAPGSLGEPSCACVGGLHTCGDGGTEVPSCSASNFPATSASATCDQGTTQVASCSSP